MDTQNMRECIESATEGPAYPLFDKWVLWAHLPHDTDWSLQSYKEIMEMVDARDIVKLYNNIQYSPLHPISLHYSTLNV